MFFFGAHVSIGSYITCFNRIWTYQKNGRSTSPWFLLKRVNNNLFFGWKGKQLMSPVTSFWKVIWQKNLWNLGGTWKSPPRKTYTGKKHIWAVLIVMSLNEQQMTNSLLNDEHRVARRWGWFAPTRYAPQTYSQCAVLLFNHLFYIHDIASKNGGISSYCFFPCRSWRIWAWLCLGHASWPTGKTSRVAWLSCGERLLQSRHLPVVRRVTHDGSMGRTVALYLLIEPIKINYPWICKYTILVPRILWVYIYIYTYIYIQLSATSYTDSYTHCH